MVAAVRRLAEIREEIAHLTEAAPSDQDVGAAFVDFDAVWESLTPREQANALALLIGGVNYDAGIGNVAITFNPTGLKDLEAVKVEETAA